MKVCARAARAYSTFDSLFLAFPALEHVRGGPEILLCDEHFILERGCLPVGLLRLNLILCVCVCVCVNVYVSCRDRYIYI